MNAAEIGRAEALEAVGVPLELAEALEALALEVEGFLDPGGWLAGGEPFKLVDLAEKVWFICGRLLHYAISVLVVEGGGGVEQAEDSGGGRG